MADTEEKPARERAAATRGGRQTQPANWHPYQQGGIGRVPRRSAGDTTALSTRGGLSLYAQNSPLRLLRHLETVDPDAALAHDTDVTLICDPECVQLIAVSDPADETPDPEDTALLTAFWQSQPPEVGGLYGFMEQMVFLANFTGLMTAEAVPGRRMEGVYRAWPVESLTIEFGRDTADSDLTAYQRQTGGKTNWKRLNSETFFWESVGKRPDDPHGGARYGAALAEVLVNLSFWKSITDAVQNAAWPRLAFGIPWAELQELYQKTLGYTEEKAADAVAEDVAQFKKEVASILPDDNVFFDSQGKMMVIAAGSFQGIEPIITERRSRIVRGLRTLPLFLGLNDSTTETQATQQVRIHGKRLGALRSRIVAIAEKIGTLHLRLMGRKTIAKAIVLPIFPGDAAADANTESVRTQTRIEWRRQGWIDNDQAANDLTGSGAVAEPEAASETEADTEPGEEEETRAERQSRERREASAAFLSDLQAEARDSMRAEYRERIRARRLAVEREGMVEV